MVFSSPVFLFLFLPAVVVGSLLAPARGRNAFLLAASLLFYAWGEVEWSWLLVLSIALNYGFGLRLSQGEGRRRVLALAIAVNLGLLGWFKYGGLLTECVNLLVEPAGVKVPIPKIHLPIGISFYTFHAISYLVDVYRRRVAPQRNLVDFALYVSLFPQLVAGPIVRYHDISGQLADRRVTLRDFALGARRFSVGLSKKVLVANTVATSVDALFGLPDAELTPLLAWLAAGLYAIQIYFDFSAYSDMAVGLGQLFGFRLPENFAYPYASRSVTEFWRRWHISLSTWFRDYLYIPLGGSRDGPARTRRNLLLVFFLCGLWHGASFNFVVWGLYHGAFLMLERGAFGRFLARAPRAAGHAYAVAVVVVGWVPFRADTLEHAMTHLSRMAGSGASAGGLRTPGYFLPTDVVVAALVGLVASAPIVPALRRFFAELPDRPSRGARTLSAAGDLVAAATALALLALSAALLASNSYNPFIYFRF